MYKIAYICILLLFSYSINCEAQVRRVRLIFESPTGYIRPLLLGFDPTNTATDGVDFGWDVLNFDDLPGDLNWMIEGDRYVVQGVGAFDNTKKYPFGLFLTYSGTFNIILDALENFNTEIDVYIYDASLDTYTQINDANYTSYMLSGDYLDKYYIAFTVPALSLNENPMSEAKIMYLRDSKDIYINTNSAAIIEKISIFNILGQKLVSLDQINTTEIKIPIYHLNFNIVMVNVETNLGTFTKKIVIH